MRFYAARMIGINEYLAAFPGVKASAKIGELELNGILFNSIPSGRSKQVCVQFLIVKVLLQKICLYF